MPEIGQAELEFRQLIEEENSLRDEVAAARQKVEVLDTLRRKKADLDKERESTGRLIGQYKQLERAFRERWRAGTAHRTGTAGDRDRSQ